MAQISIAKIMSLFLILGERIKLAISIDNRFPGWFSKNNPILSPPSTDNYANARLRNEEEEEQITISCHREETI